VSAAVQQTIDDMLGVIATDESLPIRHDSREAILAAVTQCAAEHRTQVHISWVRPLLPAWTTPFMVGAVISGLHTSGHLIGLPRYLPNGGPSGNANKPARVSRLVRPISIEEKK